MSAQCPRKRREAPASKCMRRRWVIHPSASTQGELRKKWVIRDGKRCLIKGNYGDSCQQSVNEVIATRLHEGQGRVPFTRYELCEIMTEQGMRTGCICEDFADGETEFIPAYDIVCSAKKDNALSEYEHLSVYARGVDWKRAKYVPFSNIRF